MSCRSCDGRDFVLAKNRNYWMCILKDTRGHYINACGKEVGGALRKGIRYCPMCGEKLRKEGGDD